ncbi:MAG: outer membrane lipoprotein-sorting protein [Deltaproteobacteria bacterium]|nr:outer membrane lipoprotein-sorting protein [Deltaproteobacteria bacterium]
MTCGSSRRPWLLAVALLVITRPAHADGDDPRDLVKRVLDAVPKVALTAQATLTSDRGWTRELALSRAFVDGADASYLEVTAPLALKDTRFLLVDRAEGRDEQFIYVPTVKRAMQVSDETRKQPFLGSDFNVSDMVRPELDAFTYRVVGDETVGGRAARLVEATPRTPEKELYAKTVSAIDPRDLLVLRVQFFDPKGGLLKVWTLDKVERIDGNWTPMVQRMEDLTDGHWSRLTLTEVRYGADVSPDVFKRSYLNR